MNNDIRFHAWRDRLANKEVSNFVAQTAHMVITQHGTRSSALATLPSELQQEVPVFLSAGQPIACGCTAARYQVRVKGGTQPPLKLLRKLQKFDSADTDLVSKLLKDKVALLRSSQSASF